MLPIRKNAYSAQAIKTDIYRVCVFVHNTLKYYALLLLILLY